MICDLDGRPVSIAPQPDLDRSALRTVLDGVVQQIGEDPSQPPGIPQADDLRLARLQRQDVTVGGLLVLRNHLARQADEVHGPTIQVERTAHLQPRHIEQLLDQTRGTCNGRVQSVQPLAEPSRVGTFRSIQTALEKLNGGLDRRQWVLEVV